MSGPRFSLALYLVALASAATLTSVLSCMAWRRRRVPGGWYFSVMMSAVALWSYLYALEGVVPGLTAKVTVAKAEYLGIALVPVFWLLFSLAYTGLGNHVTKGRVALLLLPSATTVLLVATNDFHRLMWTRVFFDPGNSWSPLRVEHGPWFWVVLSYSYILVVAGAALLVGAVARYPRHYRHHTVLVLFAVATPLAGNAAYALGLTPYEYLDPTPFAFGLSGIALAWAMYRFRLFELFLGIRPLARSAIFTRMQDGVLVLDAENRVADLNPAAANILGTPVHGIMGRSIHELIGDSLGTSADSGAGRETACEIRRGEGTDGRIHEAVTSPFAFGHDSRSGSLVVLHDVTERRRSEESLRQVLGALPCGVLVIQEGALAEANPEAQRILGLSSEDFPSVDPFSLVHPDHRWPLEHRLRLLAGPDGLGLAGQRVEERIVRRDGSVVWVEVSGFPITLLGRPAYAAVLIDVTSRKEAEAALRETEERLGQSQKLEAVGQLAGGIAHDFNNLLTAIVGFADMIPSSWERRLDPSEEVAEIKKAAERAAELTRQLLAFSRKQTLKPRVFDLNGAIVGMMGLLTRTLGEHIALTCGLGKDIGSVEADPGQIEQVVLNLAVNARDAMPAGGSLTIATSAVELDEDFVSKHVGASPGPHVLLAVSDTGCGIDEEAKERVFEPFFTTKEVGAGSGLGLPTVYGIVKQSGGSIWIESELGKGTCFKIYLPRVDKAVDWPPHSSPSVMPPRGGTETILIVEDEPAVRRLTARLLRREGYQVLEAECPDQALQIAAGQPIDLLLSDVVLPGISGPELASVLLESQPGCARLFMSGYSRGAVAQDGELSDGVGLLEKPFSPEVLTIRVREVLDRRRGLVSSPGQALAGASPPRAGTPSRLRPASSQ